VPRPCTTQSRQTSTHPSCPTNNATVCLFSPPLATRGHSDPHPLPSYLCHCIGRYLWHRSNRHFSALSQIFWCHGPPLCKSRHICHLPSGPVALRQNALLPTCPNLSHCCTTCFPNAASWALHLNTKPREIKGKQRQCTLPPLGKAGK